MLRVHRQPSEEVPDAVRAHGQGAGAGEGKTIMLYGVRFDYKVTSADSGGALSTLEVTIPPRILVKPHNHSREDEFTVVLAAPSAPGSGTVWSRPRPGRR
jgi:quercetin dioxygenase-like cupin family protein